MSEPRKGQWMQTIGGHKFWPLDPHPSDFRIEEIAHALSNVCRFGGHCKRFYSVAEHSVYVSVECDPEHALEGLLHDASEAYIGDMVRPLKRSLPAFSEIEEKIEVALAIQFKLSHPWSDSIKRADESLLQAEARDLLAIPPEPWTDLFRGVKPSGRTIVGLPPEAARQLFLDRWAQLAPGRGL